MSAECIYDDYYANDTDLRAHNRVLETASTNHVSINWKSILAILDDDNLKESNLPASIIQYPTEYTISFSFRSVLCEG